jgi:hypothetical protein
MEYPADSEGVLLPNAIRIRHLYRDARETEWLTVFSDCRETAEKAPEPPPTPLPSSLVAPIKLEVIAPIDTSTAAAGDVTKARIIENAPGPSKVIMPVGATLTGRIMRLEHQTRRPRSFLIWVNFDTIEAHGVVRQSGRS